MAIQTFPRQLTTFIGRDQEIADIMKTPIGTVMSRLHRGRRMLRELLADYAKERGISTAATRSTK